MYTIGKPDVCVHYGGILWIICAFRVIYRLRKKHINGGLEDERTDIRD